MWDEATVFAGLSDPARRHIVRLLAREGPQRACELQKKVGRTLDGMLKHLVTLRETGFVVTKPDPKDARRQLYCLAPSLPIMQTPAGPVMDVGSCVLRF